MPAEGSSLSDNSNLVPVPPATAAAETQSHQGICSPSDGLPALSDDRTVISNRPPLKEVPHATKVTPQHLGQLLVGKTLEHYELVEFVGGGGMGAVFRATDTRLGRTVAVKVLSRDQTDDETIRRFRNEAQSAARLDHPNIARVHYVGVDQGWNFIVFEFIEGVNLRDLVEQRGPLPLEDALIFTLQVSEALAHASGREVVHRDIKPSNVLVTADGSVKLVDMGLARLHQVESSSNDLTASGVTLGTFDYISPEQARDPRSADLRSDIYSLGCTLFYMLTGQPPFPEGTALQKLLQHNADEPPDVRLFRPELPPRVTTLLAKMLAKRPSQRPQSATDLIAEIAACAEQAGLSDVLARGRVIVSPAAEKPLFWARATQAIIAVAVLLAAIIGLDAYAPGRSGSLDVALQPKLAPAPAGTEVPAPAILPVAAPPASDTMRTSGHESAEPATGNGGSGQAAPAATAAASSTGASPSPADNGDPSAAIGALPSGGAAVASPATAAAAVDASGNGLSPPPIVAQISVPGSDLPLAIGLFPPPIAATGNAVKLTRLVVAREVPAIVPLGAEYHTSMASAARRAAELNLGEIELAYSGPLVEPPLEVAHPQLVLRAAAGERPAVVFRPQLTLASGGQQMIRLTGGPSSKLTIQGVDLSLELPLQPSSGWSLLSLRSGQSLEVRDCVLTVKNGDAEHPPAHDQVAIIAVQPRLMSDTMAMEPAAAMASSTSIVLDRTIVRGEATMIGLSEDVPLRLRWNQGLLVTPRRLLETTGSATNPKWYEQITLSLDNVTAACRQGIFQMKRRPGASYQFGLEVAVNRCILITADDAPLYDFVGVSEVTPSHLSCEGEFNRYPQPDVTFLSVRPLPGGERPATYDLRERHNWSMERDPQPGVVWRTPPALEKPAHELTKEDFLLAPSVPLDAGFDPALLPTVQQAPQPLSEDGPFDGAPERGAPAAERSP